VSHEGRMYQNMWYTVGEEPTPATAEGYDAVWRFIGATSNYCPPQ
jgi:hypothetical protein